MRYLIQLLKNHKNNIKRKIISIFVDSQFGAKKKKVNLEYFDIFGDFGSADLYVALCVAGND